MTNTAKTRMSDREERLAKYRELFAAIPVPQGTNLSDIKTERRRIVMKVTACKYGTLCQWHMRKPHRAPSWAVLRLIENHVRPATASAVA